MFFLGTQIQWDEHGRCTLLPDRTSPLKTAELQASTQHILTRSRTFALHQALITGTATRAQRTRAIPARERGLCQESIGESWQVSWR